MNKSDIHPMPEYFDRYIALAEDGEINEVLQASLEEMARFPVEQWKALGDRIYAPGKWTIKDILQHMIDTERIFTYRALCFARKEAVPPPSFDEAAYAVQAETANRTLEDLMAELVQVRASFIAMYKSFSPEVLLRSGQSFKGVYSVLSIGFIIAGHQRWHLRVIEDRYLPLLN